MLKTCDRESRGGNGDNPQIEKKEDKKFPVTSFLSSLKNLLIPTASAEVLENLCVIGGWASFLTKEGQCITPEKSCENEVDSFKCGPLFNYACIKKDKNLSQSCYDSFEVQNLPTDFDQEYEESFF